MNWSTAPNKPLEPISDRFRLYSHSTPLHSTPLHSTPLHSTWFPPKVTHTFHFVFVNIFAKCWKHGFRLVFYVLLMENWFSIGFQCFCCRSIGFRLVFGGGGGRGGGRRGLITPPLNLEISLNPRASHPPFWGSELFLFVVKSESTILQFPLGIVKHFGAPLPVCFKSLSESTIL